MYCTYSVYRYLWDCFCFLLLIESWNLWPQCSESVFVTFLNVSTLNLSTRILNKLPSMFYADWMCFASFALRSIKFAWSVFTLNSNTNTFGNKKTFIFLWIWCKSPSACITFYGCKLNDLKMFFFACCLKVWSLCTDVFWLP